jgi:cytochrome c-type biogenesis protein CcmH/NrfG
VKEHPNSLNAYDSLGEAYLKNNNRELAIENYEKSVELNPENTNAIEILKELREQN